MARPRVNENTSLNSCIESHRVEGTLVHDRTGSRIGTVRHLVVEKESGRVVSAVVRCGGFLGIGSQSYRIPWEKLRYDAALHGYRTDFTEAQVKRAPVSYGDAEIWPSQTRDSADRDYWDVPFRGL